MPTKSSSVLFLSDVEFQSAHWLGSTLPFSGMTLLRTSEGGYFCDLNAGLSPCSFISAQANAVLTLVFNGDDVSTLRLLLKHLGDNSLDVCAIWTQHLEPTVINLALRSSHPAIMDQSCWEEALAIGDQFHADLGIRSVDASLGRCRLACFDMDSTLIKAEVIDELAREAGVIEQVSAITEQAMRGELDFQQSFRQRMAMLKGLPEPAVEAVLGRIELMDGAVTLFKWLKQQGIRTAILSGGFEVFARRIQALLDIDEVFANVLAFETATLTGVAVDPIVDAEKKADKLKFLARQWHVPLNQTLAVGDGANDLKMLSTAGLGIAFRAKPKVQASARIAIRHGDLSWVRFFL